MFIHVDYNYSFNYLKASTKNKKSPGQKTQDIIF